LKKCFPNLKIGGYGSCGFYAIQGEDFVPAANSSPRTEYFVQFFEGFLAHIKKENAPLDFMSWHSYSGVKSNRIQTKYVRKMLDDFGYTDTEIVCNEWNPEINARGTAHHAALIEKMFLMFQQSPLSSAMFYDARFGVSIYGALFNPLTALPFPAYYSFVAFNELYKLKNEVQCQFDDDRIYACAATDGKTKCLVLANDSEDDIDINLMVCEKITKCVIISENNDFVDFDYNGKSLSNSVTVLYFG